MNSVKQFDRYLGIMYNHNTVDTPDLVFSVQYSDGTYGILRCGSSLHGEPKSVHNLFQLHVKSLQAKEMVPWEELGTTDEFSKETMLRISWQWLRNKGSRTE